MKTGRKAVILSIATKARPFNEIFAILEENITQDCDLVLLPEFCLGDEPILSLDGEEIQKIAALAKKQKKYIVFPVYRKSETSQRINSAILFGRDGIIAGIYDKIFPYWGELNIPDAASPGDDAPVFQTDFGKIGFAICFDANFPEVWKRMWQKGAELVLWPSAYSGGMSLQAHAINYNFYIITSTHRSDCFVFDITGQELFYGQSDDVGIYKNEIDLDRCIFHQDFNMELKDKLLEKHAGEVEMDCWLEREGWFTIRAIKPGVSARALTKEYGMEELSSYKMRSEREIDQMRGFRFVGKSI